jgi:HAD superfamily hydrolase (TIGR01549 family)
VLGVPRLSLHAVVGAVIARGGEFREPLATFGGDGWQERSPEVEAVYGGFNADDLYPDAARSIAALKAAGYRVAVVANQPAIRDEQLRASGIEVDVMAMSGALGVAKPDPAFFARTLELIGSPPPASVAYVGDRVDNDVLPAIAAGMRAVWIRRGPWGLIQELPDGTAPALVVTSLDELAARIGEAWE